MSGTIQALQHANLPAAPTLEAAEEMQRAYDYFNRELFGGELPACLITFQRKANC